jgi:outer membrane protein assembly factor BamA
MRRHHAWGIGVGALCASLALAPRAAAQAASQAAPSREVVVEVKVHGNYATPEADVLKLAGLALGQPLEPGTIKDVESRLRRSGRFDDVEIRKRYRSMESLTDVVLIIMVQEHPTTEDTSLAPPSPFKRMVGSMQVLPVLNYMDGYGFTYGGRLTFAGALGRNSRISVPLTWGGTKQAAGEFDKSFTRGPIDLLEGAASISSRHNPYYGLDDERMQFWLGVRRRLAGALSGTARGGYADVTFGDLADRLTSYGAGLIFDTRTDPVFPRNAVYASATWDGLDARAYPTVNRYHFEARGYVGLIGQSVLSVRGQYGVSSGPLPPYEQYLLGGAGNLRGYRAGSFAGDNLMSATAEVRVPLTSPLGISRIGFSLFGDVGSAYEHGTHVADTRFEAGYGGGFFILASVFKLNFDVGFREGGHARLHFSTGLQF